MEVSHPTLHSLGVLVSTVDVSHPCVPACRVENLTPQKKMHVVGTCRTVRGSRSHWSAARTWWRPGSRRLSDASARASAAPLAPPNFLGRASTKSRICTGRSGLSPVAHACLAPRWVGCHHHVVWMGWEGLTHNFFCVIPFWMMSHLIVTSRHGPTRSLR